MLPSPQTTEHSEPPPAKLTPQELEAAKQRRQEQFDSDMLASAQRERAGQWNELVCKIGERYRDCRIDALDIYDERQRPVIDAVNGYGRNIADRVSSGESLVLFGTPGTGKDHILAALMRHAILNHGLTVEWKNGMDLYGDFRDAIDSKETRESRLIKNLVAPDILCLSDPIPPFGELKEYQASTLFRIVDGRYRQRKPTWMTLNVASGNEFASKVSEAIVDRLRHGATTLHCDWPSYRRQK